MNLRIDELLAELQSRMVEVLQSIDRDELLTKKEHNGVILANASKVLFSPTETHQLLAKGIVYRRNPWRLVSLPLIKIFNLNEREFINLQTLTGLIQSAPTDRECRLHFLRKYDGTMIQRFQEFGQIRFTTRGTIEGLTSREQEAGFDYLGSARQIARERYPALLEDRQEFESLSMVFELIHPESRVITDYGERRDLLLLAVMDRSAFRYLPFDELRQFAERHGLAVVDAFTPIGVTLGEQIDSMLSSIAGTDQEGAVLTLEFGHEVVFRAKVKSPDYLQLLRLMVNCTYAATAELLKQHPEIETWEAFEPFLRSRGTETVPEELIEAYRSHFIAYRQYLVDCEKVLRWAKGRFDEVQRDLGSLVADVRGYRKLFATNVQTIPHNMLLFAALDDKLTLEKVCKLASTPDEIRASLILIGEVIPPSSELP